MKQLLAVSFFLAVVVSQSVTNAEDAGPAKDVPELQALQNYVGTWDVVFANNEFTESESTARWIVGGRFVEQTGVMLSDNGKNRVEILTLFTFDTTRKTYRSWTFLSTGSISEAELTWDAKSSTMTSVTRPDASGARSTVTADFSMAGKERWKFRFTDRDRNSVGEMSGLNTLRKDAATTPKPVVTATDFSDRSAELKVLDRYLGTWRSEYRLPKAVWTPEEKRGSAESISTRELGGRFIRERAQHSDKSTATMLLTFDADKRNYRGWWFNSLGQANESTGRWDEVSQTLLWTGVEPNDFKVTSQYQFQESGKLDWKVLAQDKQGVAMFRMEGNSTRIEKK